MMMKRLAVAVVLCVVAAPVLLAVAEPLPSDSRLSTGKLANGVTWVFRQHDNPPGKLALMVHIDSGSLNEEEAQRGVAHFLEHMVFNGTEHFPPGELLKYFESIGMEFGADLNAFTGFDQTAYMLFLPNTEVEQVDKGLMTLSDYVFRALLLEDEINKERGVIMEEWRSGKSAERRVFEETLKQVYAGTRFAERVPIGLPEVITKAPREVFEQYYRTWYRPENITVILVGDTTLEPMMPALEKWFGQYQGPETTGKARGPEFKPFTEARAFVITDPELSACEVELTNIGAARPVVTTSEQYREQLLETVATWIVNRRLSERVQKGEASYRRAYTYVSDFLQGATMAAGSAEGEPENWAPMLEELTVEIVRGREHGFTKRELEMAEKEITASAERAVETESTRSARSVLMQINGAVNDGTPIMSAAQELELTKKLLPTIKLEEVNAAFAKHFSANTFASVVTMPEKENIKVPSQDEVLAAAKAALARKTTPLEERAGQSELLVKMPEPGKVLESTIDEDLRVTSAWLENGIRVHHRFMDYKKDEVLVSIVLAGGRIEETLENLGVTEMLSSALRRQPATSRLTSTDTRDILTGKNISVGSRATADTLELSVNGSPKDLETGLQLAYALLTDGVVEESVLKVWKQEQIQRYTMAQTVPTFRAYEALADAVFSGDPRLQPLIPKDRVEALELATVQAWWDRMRKDAPIEVAVVGEIDATVAMELVQKYLGSLPARGRDAERLASLRILKPYEGPWQRRIDVPTVTDKGMAIAGFMGGETRNVPDVRALELASNVLTSRLIERVREELGLVYSLRAGNNPSSAYVDAGMFVTMAPCDPAKAGEVVDETHKIFAAFAETGPTDVELVNAKKQIDNNLEESQREPRHWVGVLRDLHYHGKLLDDEKADREAFQALTAEQVKEVFKKYYLPNRQFSVTAVPTMATPEKTPETEKSAETEKTPVTKKTPEAAGVGG